MEMDAINYIFGTAFKYGSLVVGVEGFITLDFPKDYVAAGICGLTYIAGEVMQKIAKDKELGKTLEDKIKEIKK